LHEELIDAQTAGGKTITDKENEQERNDARHANRQPDFVVTNSEHRVDFPPTYPNPNLFYAQRATTCSICNRLVLITDVVVVVNSF